MAIILDQLESKTIGETVAGELFRMELRDGFATCVTLENGDQGPFLIGILAADEVDRPSYLPNPERPTRCASFGIDWIIEPIIGAETYPRRGYVHEDVGLLYLQGDDAILRFDRVPNPRDMDSVNVSLVGHGRVERAIDAIPFRRWRIWQSLEMRNRHGTAPLLEFPLQ